jgi:SAM-dependent methyltransferase
MNSDHDQLCSSPGWAEYISHEIVPWCLTDLPATGDLLEIGGGFGAATGRLLDLPVKLTVVEKDPALATSLAARFPGASVLTADATSTGLEPDSFDAAVCFTMLHHVTPAYAQDQLFAEVFRLLRPGAWYAGTDSLGSDRLRDFHEGDVYEPVEPSGLPDRLAAVGFTSVETELGEGIFRFRCLKPL